MKWKVNSNLYLLYTTSSPSFIQDLATVFEFNARRTEETRRSLLHDKTCAGVSCLYLSRQRKNHKDRCKLAETIAILTYNRLLFPVDYRYWMWPPVALYNLGQFVFFPDFNELLSRNDYEKIS